MVTVDGVIKDAIKFEVEAVIASFKQSLTERFGPLEQRLESLSTLLDTSSKNAEEKVAKSHAEALAESSRGKADLEAVCNSLKAQLQRFESDEGGPGGIKQLREKLDEMGTELRAFDTKLQDQAKATRTVKGRVDTIEDSVAALSRQGETLTVTMQKCSEQVQQLQTTGTALEQQLRESEDAWARKHEELWQDLHRVVEEVRNDHREALQEDLSIRRDEMKQKCKSHVNYITQLLANGHQARRADSTRKGIFQVWREQTWAEKSQKAGYKLVACALKKMVDRREQRAVDRWRHATAVESLASRLKGEYESKIPAFQQVVDASTNSLQEKCAELFGHVAGIRQDLKQGLEDKCPRASHVEAVAVQSAQMQMHVEALQGLKDRLHGLSEEHQAALSQAGQKQDEHNETLQACRSEFAECTCELAEKLTRLKEGVDGCARSEDVQQNMRDTLLIWNSLKQLDAAKADKSMMDAFALEVSTSCEQTARGVEEMHALGKGSGEQASYGCQELQARLEATTNHWQAMWEQLTGLLEETVAKVADLQATVPRVPLSGGTPQRVRTRSPLREVPTPRASSAPREPVSSIPLEPTAPSSTRRQMPPATRCGGYPGGHTSSASTIGSTSSPMAGQLVLSGSSISLAEGRQNMVDEVNGRIPPSPSFPPSDVKVGRLRPSSASRRPPAPAVR